MRTLKTLNGNTVQVYSTAKEMPIVRYNEFQKYLLIDSGIGADVETIDGHYAKQIAYIASDKKDDAIKEAENTRHALASVLSGINYGSMAFAVMVTHIDGVPYDDISEEGIERTVKVLEATGISQGEVEEATEVLKKKIVDELGTLFPALTGNDQTYEHFAKLRIYVLEMCDTLTDGEIDEYRARELYDRWLSLVTPGKPLNFTSSDPENVLTGMDRLFVETCAQMEKNGSTNPEKYTVVQFWAKIDFIQKEAKRGLPDTV